MHISIELFEGSDRFNVCLASKASVQPFLTIKGCKIIEGKNGPFISWPAWKNKNDEWKSHCYATDAFQAAVIEKVRASEPPKDTRTHAERKRPDPRSLAEMEDDIPW